MSASGLMEILFLCQRVPYPPDRGDRITTHHVLRMLQGMGRVRVGCFLEHPRDLEGVKVLRDRGIEVLAIPIKPKLRQVLSLAWLPTRRPLTLPYFFSRKLAVQVDEWVKEVDLAFCYSSSMGQYLLGPEAGGTKRVMQFAELDSDKWAQLAKRSSFPGSWIYQREAKLLLPFEQRVANEFDLSLVVSPVEKQLFMERIPGVEPLVVENGVDTESFAPTGVTSSGEEAVIFTGVMNYEPNVRGMQRFVQQIWPQVRAARPKAQLLIVGSDPTPSIQTLNGQQGITVTGRVPKTQPWFEKAQVAIAPLWIARGIQNKVLEAMSMALPVVATPAAFSGIDATIEEHLFVEEEPQAFATRVISLLQDPTAARAIGKAARDRMKCRYGWDTILERLQKELQALAR